MTKAELLNRIANDRGEIRTIQIHLSEIRPDVTTLKTYHTNVTDNGTSIGNFDITDGNNWKKDLCDTAVEMKGTLKENLDVDSTSIQTLRTQLNSAISNMESRISDLHDDISWCQAEIERIEEEERISAAQQQAQNAKATQKAV